MQIHCGAQARSLLGVVMLSIALDWAPNSLYLEIWETFSPYPGSCNAVQLTVDVSAWEVLYNSKYYTLIL